MVAIRLPLAMSSSALLGIAMFWALWFLVSKPADVGKRFDAIPVEFTRIVPPALPPPPPRREHVERPTLPQVPGKPGIDVDPPSVRGGGSGLALTPVFQGNRGGTVIDPPMGGVDRDAIPVVRVDPEYPRSALIKDIEGWVLLQFSITATGRVADAIVIDSSPPRVFDVEALKAVERWRYEPKIVDGAPVERLGLRTLIRFEVEAERRANR